MKIAFVTSSLNGGGISSYAHEVVNCFSEAFEMTVIVGDDSKAPFDIRKVKVVRCESNDTSLENAMFLLNLLNESLRPDVIINSNSILMTLISPFVDNSIRIISISHSLRYNEADNAGFNSQYIDQIVALSTYNEAYLRKKYSIHDADKIRVIYNFVDELPNVSQLIAKKKNAKPLRIVYAGGTSATKSPELVFNILLQLLKTDREFEFIFMGAHSPTMQRLQPFESIQQLMAPDKRVKFTGRLPRVDAEDLISSANLLLIPSRREGCPITMLEGMRAGCIIITSDYKNACREMVEDGRSGFIINHSDVKGFVSRILDILDHHDKYLSFYDECYQNYIRRFSFPQWRNSMVILFHDDNTSHVNRIETFNKLLYLRMKRKLSRQFQANAIHMLFHESLKSAIPFFLKYIKSKVTL